MDTVPVGLLLAEARSWHAAGGQLLPEARAAIHAARDAGPPIRYGTPDWRALLPQGLLRPVLAVVPDPRWLAAIFAASEAWRDSCRPEPIEAELRAQLDADDDLVLRRIRQASWDVGDGGGLHWSGPSHVDLMRRRAEPGQLAEDWRTWHGCEYPGSDGAQGAAA